MSLYLRLRRFVATSGPEVAVALLLVAVAAGGGAWYVYSNPPTERFSQEVDQQSVSVSASEYAVVTHETPLYELGERLERKSLYLLSVSPNATFTVDGQFPADQPTNVTVDLKIRAAASYDGQAYWEDNWTLVQASRVVRDGAFSANETVNMSAVREYMLTRRAATGDLGTFSSDVVLSVSYDTGTYTNTLTGSAPLVFTGNGYAIEGDIALSEEHARTVTRRTEGEADPAVYGGLALVSLLSLAALAGIVVEHRRGIDVAHIDEELARIRHDEWISRGELPLTDDVRYVEIETLDDLVDIAIDSNKRVIHDRRFDAYAVVDADNAYFYTAGDLDIGFWVDV